MKYHYSAVALLETVLLKPFCCALSTPDWSRRRMLEKTSQGLLVGFPAPETLWNKQAAWAIGDIPKTVPKDKAVLVLGANGQTGRECVSFALASGRPCIATSRSGSFAYADSLGERVPTDKLSTKALDVTKADMMQSVIQNTPNLGAVIFAASASTKGGDAFSVDKNGVIYAAQACIDAKVPRLVIVSSGTVTRPDSAVYKLLNTVGKGIMEAKIKGEDEVRALYAAPSVLEQGIGYTVVRPGGLTSGVSLGVEALELNQGDNKSGRLSRADVAAICVNALDSASTWDTTFECYEALTGKPIESVGFSNILKLKGESTFVSGKERRGSTWSSIFDGLEIDHGHA
eukprot:scaffold3077_cov162-Amphora_coffeaeformis.AAC.12